MIDVAKPPSRTTQFPAVVESHDRASIIDRDDCSELAVSDAEHTIGTAELNAVASGEKPLFLAEDLDAEEPGRIVFDASSVGSGLHGKRVGLAINRFDASVVSLGNRELFAATREANNVAFFIVVRHRPLRSREAAIDENCVLLA